MTGLTRRQVLELASAALEEHGGSAVLASAYLRAATGYILRGIRDLDGSMLAVLVIDPVRSAVVGRLGDPVVRP